MAHPDNPSGAPDRSPRRGAARDAMSSASGMAGKTGQRVRDESARTAGQAQDQARAFLAEQKGVAADHIDNVSQVLHQTVDQLRQRSPGAVSDYAERAVQGLDSVATALRDQDVRSLVGTVEDFARRQPALFMFGSVALGFACARFLKSSSSEDYGQGARQGSYQRADSGDTYGHRPEGHERSGASGTEYRRHLDVERQRSRTSLSESAPAMGSSDGPASPQFSTTRSAQDTADEAGRAMRKEPE